MKTKLFILPIVFAVSACSSPGIKKVVIDSSPNKPDWIESQKMAWEKDSYVYFKAKETVRGDQRVNGCHDLANLNNREQLLRGMADEIKGQIDQAQTDISENAELLIGKVRSGKFEGRITGFQDDEQYFERYVIQDQATKEKTERIDCFLLSKISKADYMTTKHSVVNKIVAVDPRIKEAIVKKQVDFFSEAKKSDEARAPASVEPSKTASEQANTAEKKE